MLRWTSFVLLVTFALNIPEYIDGSETLTRLWNPVRSVIVIFLLYLITKSTLGGKILLFGLILNLLVVLIFGGLMPVERSVFASIRHEVPSEVRLGWTGDSGHVVVEDSQNPILLLGDWIDSPFADGGSSPGDLLFSLGGILFLTQIFIWFKIWVVKLLNKWR